MLESGNGRGEPPHEDGFRWECPVCEKSRVNAADDEDNAVSALQTHLTASSGDGHGPRNEMPSDLDSSTLSAHVVRVDDGGKAAESDE